MTDEDSSTDNDSKTNSKPSPLRVAMLGAGLFATNSHAPILKKHPEIFEIRVVWSRGKESATKLANALNCEALDGSETLDALLARSDIDAFVVALPLDVQPDLVVRLLKAGKHVLSEKPIAPTLEKAKSVLNEYCSLKKQHPGLVWSVAENYRYEPGIQKAAELVKSSIGDIIMVSLVVKNPFRSDNPYLNTSWRKNPSWYGGLFIDAFIHAVAGLRAIVPGELQQVSAVTSHVAEHLPGPDTLAAHLKWNSGVVGTISASYASDTFRYVYEITGKLGTVLLQRSTTKPGYDLILARGFGKNAKQETTFFGFEGIEREFLAFAKACKSGNPNDENINSPLEAVKDVEFVEALLQSGKPNQT